MCDFHMAALMFHASHGMKARTHAHAGMTHFPTWCIIRTLKALSWQPFPGPDDAQRWEMCDFCMVMGSCYNLENLHWLPCHQLLLTIQAQLERILPPRIEQRHLKVYFDPGFKDRPNTFTHITLLKFICSKFYL